jgi:hypothetical protein
MAYMATVPMMSTSQALESPMLLIMLMRVQGTTPKNSSMAVQHWMAVACRRVCFIHWSTATPNLAIFIKAAEGMPLAKT